MTPKEKAKEIYTTFKFELDFYIDKKNSALCAKYFSMFSVNQILKAHLYDEAENKYWYEVIKEIQEL